MRQSPQASCLQIASSSVGFACGALLFSATFALCEAVGCVSGLHDFAVMRDAVQQRGCHLCITKDRDPFAELQVGGDDDTGLLVEFADQVEQQRAAGFRERDVAQFVDDDAIHGCQLPDDFPCIAFGLFLDQCVDQIDCVEEACLLAIVDQRGSERDGDVGFACASSAHQNEVVGIFGELACAEGIDPDLGDGGRTVIEGGEVLVMGELGNPHLILDGTHPAFYGLGVDQLLYRSGQARWLARGQQIMCASCHSMQSQVGQLVDEGIHAATSFAMAYNIS